MSVEEEDTSLKDLVTKTLQNNGVLGKIQAQLRASVFLALEEEFKEKNVPLVSPSVKQLLGTREGALAAALVQDFLQSLNLDFSLSVFAPESGQSALWNFPGKDAVKKDLKLDTRKGDGPLLLEILRERESPRLSKNEDYIKQPENQIISGPSMITGKPLNPSLPPLNESKQLPQIKNFSLDIMEQNDPELKKLPIATSKTEDSMTNGDDKEHSSSDSQSGGNTDRTITNSKSLEDDNGESEGSAEGVEKQYEEDFSSMSQEGQEEEEMEEEIEEDEDIEEDISDLVNLSISTASDHTKDQSISQASDIPNYQEDL